MNLIQELYALQETHGHLREEDLRALSRRIKVPLYEIEGVSAELAQEACRLASHKLPCKTKFLIREGHVEG